jgi:hypothetical protein
VDQLQVEHDPMTMTIITVMAPGMFFHIFFGYTNDSLYVTGRQWNQVELPVLASVFFLLIY